LDLNDWINWRLSDGFFYFHKAFAMEKLKLFLDKTQVEEFQYKLR